MFKRLSAEAAELLALEHLCFPRTSMLVGILMAGNVGSVVLMLLAQS